VSVCVEIGSKFGNESSLKINWDTILADGDIVLCTKQKIVVRSSANTIVS